MQVIDLFKTILTYKSLTPNDAGAFSFIRHYLYDWDVIEHHVNGVQNILIYKKFGAGEHLCFAWHIDVVPPGEGWESDPFEPVEKDGFIYARGAQDMKSGLSCFLQAAHDTTSFNGTLSILLTSDEEGDATYGTIKMLEHLKSIDFLPDFAVVAEPTCEKVFGDAIKVGRRGSINGYLEIKGKQGHAAYPEKTINPVHQISAILPQIAGINLDEGDEYFAPSQLVITDIRAGMEVTNVTPGKLNMMFNVRNSTKTDKDKIEHFFNKHFSHLDYSLRLAQSAKPFVTNKTSKIVTLLSKVIQDTIHVTPKLSTAGGTSDARFFGEFGVDTVEFGPINDTIHAPNERVTKKEVLHLHKIFVNLINTF